MSKIILLQAILLFCLVYFAVHLAIKPLLKKEGTPTNDEDFGIVELRDIYVLTDNELEEVIKILQEKNDNNKAFKQYKYYSSILKELVDIGYFSENDYSLRLEKLKEHFKINKAD